MQTQELVEKINKLKKEKNAVVLAHSYQNVEIDLVADFVGDSLYLSRKAAETDADIIVFAGVTFMAETSKILSPSKKVLLPRKEAGCLMADMIDLNQLREFKAQHPNIPVVCYVNSTAEVKSESDICCTSANAINVIKSLKSDKVLFVPDTYLGTYAASQIEGVEVIPYPGFCPTHLRITKEDVAQMREKHPEALVLTHPECHKEVVNVSDFVGSTTAIMKYAAESTNKEFIIVTEKGVVERLERDYPEKKFYLISEKAICPNMKWNELIDIYNSLKYEQYEITVDEEIAKKALHTIEKMVAIS